MRVHLILISLILLSCTSKTNSTPEPSQNCEISPVYSRTYRDSALNIINKAHKFVYLWMFEVANYRDSSNPLLSALCKAKKRGLDVKALIEGGEGFLGDRFYKKQHNAYLYLKKCGVEARLDRKGITTHVKMLLADTNLIIGSTNWTYYGIERNNELNVLVRGKGTEKFGDLFLREFKKSKGNKFVKGGGQEIQLKGKIVYVSERVSRRGKAYTIFKIKSGRKTYRVFIRGHHHLRKGERILLKGTFYRTKRVGKRVYHNEIEARYIRRL